MGAYLYKVYGPDFPVKIFNSPSLENSPATTESAARMCKYWMKPYWEAWDTAVFGGRSMSFWSDSEKRCCKLYKLWLGKLNKSEPVSIFVLSRDEKRNKPAEGDMVLVFPSPRFYVWDDPNWEGARIGTLRWTDNYGFSVHFQK